MKIIVAGGCEGWCVEKRPLASAELYDPATNSWTPLPNMLYPIHSGKMEQVNGYPTIIGGVTEDFTKETNLTRTGILQSYNPDAKEWFVPKMATENKDGRLIIPRSSHTVIQVPKHLVANCIYT